MALDRTSGFDLLVQISETEINTQVATAFANGDLFPQSLETPVTIGGINGTLTLNFQTPVIDLDRPRPRVGISVAFTNSQLEISGFNISPLGGTILIVDALQINGTPGSGTQQAVLDFTSGAPVVTISFDSTTTALITPFLPLIGLTMPQLINQVAAMVLDRLVSDVQRIALTPPIDVADDDDALTPFSFDITTINDTSAADRDAIVFGVRTSSSTGGNINSVTQNFIPSGQQTMIMLSNFWLLARVVRPRLADALGTPVTSFDTPLRLNHSIPVPGEDATITKLEAHVEGNRIRVDGRATAEGTGWSAVATFSFFISLTLEGGQIHIVASEPAVDIDVDLAWWVWVLTFGVGAFFGGIIGGVIAIIVLAIVEAVAEGIVENMAIDAFNEAAGQIPPIPLGPIGAGITLNNLILDDLELRGPIIRSLNLPVKNAGTHNSDTGFTIDLDNGQVRAAGSVAYGTDLSWDPATGFQTVHNAGITITSASYGSLTPAVLEKMSFASHSIAAANIPLSITIPFFGMHNEIVFGVYTTDGRYAKVRAWREISEGLRLHMVWTTYDRPAPELNIALRWEITDSVQQSAYINKDFATCKVSEVSRKCYVEAWPRLLAFPINYQWCLCGTVLEEGDGEVNAPSGPIPYRLSGRRLEFTTSMGQALHCDLCVSAIDIKGRELFTCVKIDKGTTETSCGKPRRFITKPPITFIPCDPEEGFDRYESVLSEKVQTYLSRAMGVKHAAAESASYNAKTKG